MGGIQHQKHNFTLISPQELSSVNVDIFTCIHFRGFMKIGDIAKIRIRVLLSITGSIGFYKSNFQWLYFCGYLRNTNNAKIYGAKISTFTVYCRRCLIKGDETFNKV